MNKIKLSDSDKRLLIIFLAILMVAASYFFFFTRSMSKASDIEDGNTKDQAQVQQMEQMEAALPQVRENMKNLKQKQADIIAKYPSDIKTEKVIWILQDIEDHNDYHISDIAFAMYYRKQQIQVLMRVLPIQQKKPQIQKQQMTAVRIQQPIMYQRSQAIMHLLE